MKIKNLFATALLGLSLTGVANAQGLPGVNYVYITGSTAFRNSVYATLNTGGQVFDSAPTFSGFGSGTASKSTYMIFSNNISSVPYIIKCEWSGSEAGVIDAVSNVLETFPADSELASAPGANSSPSTPPSIDSHQNDLALVDNDQGHSRTTKPNLTGGEVGVIPFTFVKNAQIGADKTADWTAWNNVTVAQVNTALLNNGTPLSMFTGNAADTNFVYVAGRNNNSGTRANFLLNAALSVKTAVGQIYVTGGSATDLTGNTPITFENQALLGIANGASTYCGNDGQDSGGTLATTMTYLGSGHQADPNQPYVGGANTGWYAIAYLGRSDANTAISGGAVELLFQGVAESPANIESGVFPFWGNEWVYKALNDSANSGPQGTVYSKLVSKIPTNLDGTTGIPYSSMSVYKTTSASYPIENGF
jgi:hypothetical protein